MTLLDPPLRRRIGLMRHAHAGSAMNGQRDFDRTLTDAGYDEAEIVGDRAADKGFRPDLILSSTAMRCRQTAEAMHRTLGETIELRFVDELYNGSLETYVQLLSAQDTNLLLIGHNPAIEEVLLALVGLPAMQAAITGGYPTAGLAILDRSDPREDSGFEWTLTEFVTGWR